MRGFASIARIASGLFSTMLLAAAMGCQSTAAGGSDSSLPALAALPEQADQVQPLEVGDRAPVAAVRDAEGTPVDLRAAYRNNPTMLVFYRGGWCPYCTRHLSELAAVEDDVRALGIQVIAVSPDRPEKLRESLGEHELPYQLLSDSNVELTRAFGLAFRVDDETNDRLRGFGIDLEDASGRSHRVLRVPAVYLIDRQGTIRFAHWNPDYTKRISGDAVLNAARALAEQQ